MLWVTIGVITVSLVIGFASYRLAFWIGGGCFSGAGSLLIGATVFPLAPFAMEWSSVVLILISVGGSFLGSAWAWMIIDRMTGPSS